MIISLQNTGQNYSAKRDVKKRRRASKLDITIHDIKCTKFSIELLSSIAKYFINTISYREHHGKKLMVVLTKVCVI